MTRTVAVLTFAPTFDTPEGCVLQATMDAPSSNPTTRGACQVALAAAHTGFDKGVNGST